MSCRLHLLTFSHCPASTCPGLDEFYGHMAARSLVFENHYLQRPVAKGPFEALGADTSFTRLHASVANSSVSVRTVLIGNACETATPQLPEWLNATAITGDGADGMPGLPNEYVAQLRTTDFSWVHAVLPAAAGVEQLSHLVTQAQQIASDAQGVLIVTFLNGGAVCKPDRFQSQLFEGDIRVPLWIQSPHPPCRIQALTGSLDIPMTLADELDAGDRDLLAQGSVDGAANLLRFAENPGSRQDRRLFVNADGTTAIRTSNFLFVQTGAEPDAVSALYAKPEDLWNVNDVSAEYHEVVEELRNLVRQAGLDDDDATPSGPA
ncbi:MAG: hypothetical protein GY758_26950 [Fuerstiella sp.]|nr:hypothetical protein [Fuerstiella sp.]MCP4783397.1 hypothetical protein [Fuerstiella sp.]MCP4858705.1 hypothetical protein [Fuerstiella sp.]